MELWQIKEIIQRALKEDIPFEDQTTELLIPANLIGRAYFLAKSNLVICGIPVAELVFKEIDPEIKFKWLYSEGTFINSPCKFGYVEGRVKNLLKGERVALNFLQHLSGIATTVRKMCQVLNSSITLIDTRKTLPGLKILQKYAVRIGGGKNHRYSLSDGILIKDNHIKALGGLKETLEKIKEVPHYLKVEIEIKNLEELKYLLESSAKVDAVLLDNFPLDTLKEAIRLIKSKRPNLKIEISGGISEDNLKKYKDLEIDYISSGALTHSVKAVDISFKIEEVWQE
ncbi:MAG: carboxylating nicotinate-nucleotide diphosphorylase [Caldimicrobium sp.]